MPAQKLIQHVGAGNPGPATNNKRMYIEQPIIGDFVFGVLRRNYSGLTNDAREFVRKKLQPIAPIRATGPSTSSAWVVTATRYEVLLPAEASDTLDDPRRLVELFEDVAPPGQKDLLITVKLTARTDGTLHAFWERARYFARTAFVLEHGLPAVLAMHVAQQSGTRQPTRPHIHLMALPRELNAFGFAGRSTIAVSGAQCELVEKWKATGQ